MARMKQANGIVLGSRVALALSSLLAFSACGKFLEKFGRLPPSGHTFVKVQSQASGASLLTPQVGGVVVYALRSDGYAQSFPLSNETDTNSEFALPNGNYRFLAVGWDAVDLAGTTRCGEGVAGGVPGGTFNLVGQGTVTVPITINAATCNTPNFAANPDFHDGSDFKSPAFVFCGPSVDTSNFNSASLCTNGIESHRFFAGRTPGTPPEGVDRAEYDPSSGRIVYVADLHQDERFELYSGSLTGPATVMQNIPLASGGDVIKAEVAWGKGKVVYSADQEIDGVTNLYISTLGTQGSTKLSGAICGSCAGVRDFAVSRDGNYAVFVAEKDNLGVDEIYSVNLSTLAAPVKLNGSAAGAGAVDWGSGRWSMAISPDSLKVVFAGNFDSATIVELYSTGIATAASPTKISGSPGNANFDITDFRINYNSDKVIWRGDFTVDNSYELYGSAIGAANSEVLLHPAAGNGVAGYFGLSDSADLVAYSVDTPGLPGKLKLNVTNFSTLASPTTTIVHDTTNNNVIYRDFLFTPDNSRLAYLSDDAAVSVNRAYTALVGTIDSKVDRTHSPLGSSIPFSGGGGDRSLFVFDNDLLFYRGDETTNPSQWSLFGAPITSPGTGVRKTPAPTASMEVKGIAAGLSRVFYSIDDAVDGEHRLHSYNPSDTTHALVDLGTQIYSVSEIHIPSHADSDHPATPVPGRPNALFLTGQKSAANTMQDLFYLPDYTSGSATSLVKVTRAYDSPSGSGRFRVSLLRYKRDPGGNIIESSDAISGPCSPGPTSTDGSVVTTPILRVPAGPPVPSQNPFVVAVDVYGDATDCSGSGTRYLFPAGLANATQSPQASKIKLITGGSSPRIFIKD
jgi:hypothetical protein